MNNFGVVNACSTLEVPKNGMAISIAPAPGSDANGSSMFDVGLFSNFEQDLSKLSERDKVIFLICQGILKMAKENGEVFFRSGLTALDGFISTMSKPVDLEHVKPEGTA